MKWPSHYVNTIWNKENHRGMKLVLVRVFSCKHSPNVPLIPIREWMMETCKVVLTFESADEILWCDDSIETFSPILVFMVHCALLFFFFSFRNCVEIWLWSQLGLKWLRPSGQAQVMLYFIRAERPKTTPCVATCSLFSSTLSWYFYYIDACYM